MPSIKALLRERESYVRRGLPDRVALVDAQLEMYGHDGGDISSPSAPLVDESVEVSVDSSPGVETATPRKQRSKRW